MDAIWEREPSRPRFGTLRGNAKTDVLIVGGGIAGILCAYALKETGVDLMVVEADEICGATTKNTTAKITLTHGLLYDKLIRRFGEEGARQYLEAQQRACERYAAICRGMDCDYELADSYAYSLNGRQRVEREVKALCRLGVKAEFSNAPALPFRVDGAVCVANQAQLHPLKFLFSIAKELPIFEHTKVKELKPGAAVIDGGEISFRRLVIATHFPILNKHGLYPLKLYQHRSYVLALGGAQPPRDAYVDENDRGLSFRRYGDLLLLGGGGHRTGKRGGCWAELEAFAGEHYKGAEAVARWATQDCMTLDGIPYIGQYAKSTPDVYVATGFGKWGMTNAMVASEILSALISGKSHPAAALFSPSRSMLRPQLAVNVLESALGLLTPTVPRCPHLGCALKYNRAEHTWDCPCHGSRFAESGELIDGPATDDKHP